MAFNSNADVVIPAAAGQWEKASAFINIYAPKKDGSRAKVGAVPLRISKETEKRIMDIIAQEGDAERVLSKLVLEYNLVTGVNGDDLDL